MNVCHSFTEEVDVNKLLELWLAVDPCGADVAIQIQTYVFSTSDGGIPISPIAHLRSMVEKVDGLEQIGRRVEGILEVLKENFEVVQKLRELVYGSLDLEMPDEFPENDFSQRHIRTQAFANAVRSIRSAPLNAVATLEDVGPAFDLERSRFFFQGQLLHHERLTVAYARGSGPSSVSAAAARIFANLAEGDGLEDFVTSFEFDSIVATMELAFRFYNDFTVQLERSIMYFQAMFKTYETSSTFLDVDVVVRGGAGAGGGAGGSYYQRHKRHRTRESTLDIAIREGVFTPPAATPAPEAEAEAEAEAAPEAAAAAAPVPVVPVFATTTPLALTAATEPNATPERKKYLPRLPAPLGFEPDDDATTAAATAAAEGGDEKRRQKNPCPVKPPCASALFAKCADLQGLFEGGNTFARASQVYSRIPDDHVIKHRLDDFFQRDLRVRYFPLLTKILVNYAPRDRTARTRRIGDMRPHHKLYVRELYLIEHARVVAGGEVPSLEELTAPYDFTDEIRSIFAEGELHGLVAPFIV